MQSKLLTWLLLFTFILAGCAGTALQAETTDEPKSPSFTATRPPATRTPTIPKPSQTPTPGKDTKPSPLEPLPGEKDMVSGEVFADSFDILLLESFPVQVNLVVSGNLPTPCHNLRAKVSEPDENGRIDVELFSLTKTGVACIQVLESFEATIPLGSFSSGSYSVYVGGDKVGEFEL